MLAQSRYEDDKPDRETVASGAIIPGAVGNHRAGTRPRCTLTPRSPHSRTIEHRGTNTHPETAIRQIFKFDVLGAPDLFDCPHRCAPWHRLALFELVDRSLCQTDTQTQFALTPAEHGPRQTDFGRKPLNADELAGAARTSSDMNGH
jgi:hypothetical protein